MFLVDALLILAMLFFLFLPITDRRTVRMRLCMFCALLAVFSVSITRTPIVQVLLASLASPPGTLRPPFPVHKRSVVQVLTAAHMGWAIAPRAGKFLTAVLKRSRVQFHRSRVVVRSREPTASANILT